MDIHQLPVPHFPFPGMGKRGPAMGGVRVGTDGETVAWLPEMWGSQDSDAFPDHARFAISRHHTELLGLPG